MDFLASCSGASGLVRWAAMVSANPSVISGEPLRRQPFADIRVEGRCLGWCEHGLVGAPDELDAMLDHVFAARPQRTLRVIPGRATFAWPADDNVVVKRYERGSHADAWHDMAWIRVFRTAGRREAENLRELALSGLPVPKVLGWCEERLRWPWMRARRSVVWMECVEHADSLSSLFAREPSEGPRRWSDELARLVARLHDQGWYHRDAYLEHWLVTERGLVLLDVGRARREPNPRRRWFVKDVAALAFSCPSGVSARARLRFLASYLDRRCVRGRAERRAFARDVLAKARRIAEHVPRHIDVTSLA